MMLLEEGRLELSVRRIEKKPPGGADLGGAPREQKRPAAQAGEPSGTSWRESARQFPAVDTSEELLQGPAQLVNHTEDMIQRRARATYIIPFRKTYFY